MNKLNLTYRITVLLLIGLTLSACSLTIAETTDKQETQEVVIGMANPAALYCEGMGYGYESVERDGGMDADCVFPDGERCGQWDFLAGRCGQEMTFCESLGGTIQANGNIGTCLFSDNSTCSEYQLFNNECSAGENPAPVVDDNAETEEAEVEESEDTEILITDFISARDYLIAYLAEEYGVENLDPWMETNLTSPDAAGVTTFRFVSGSLTVFLSAEASAPYASQYTVQEVSDLATGFWWTGSITFDGTIIESEVVLPWSILDPEHAKDAALGYLYVNYDVSSPADWVDEGSSQAGDAKISRQYSAGTWTVVIEFEPAAPFVSSYLVIVENTSLGILWEGQVTGQGEISQISFDQ